MYPSTSTQQPAAICALKSPADAIHILEAVRLGLVPRVTRRLTGHERQMIRPGTVWVWEEEETNMRRWTDGRRWGASRVGGGGFLVYTESSESLSPPPSRPESPASSAFPNPGGNGYYGSTPPRRPEPLVKQTYSTSMTHPVNAKAKKFHVVAYSSKHNPQGDGQNSLPLPHQLPNLAHIKITPGIWPDWETRRDDYNSRRQGMSAAPNPASSGTTALPASGNPGYPDPYRSAGGPASGTSSRDFPPPLPRGYPHDRYSGEYRDYSQDYRDYPPPPPPPPPRERDPRDRDPRGRDYRDYGDYRYADRYPSYPPQGHSNGNGAPPSGVTSSSTAIGAPLPLQGSATQHYDRRYERDGPLPAPPPPHDPHGRYYPPSHHMRPEMYPPSNYPPPPPAPGSSYPSAGVASSQQGPPPSQGRGHPSDRSQANGRDSRVATEPPHWSAPPPPQPQVGGQENTAGGRPLSREYPDASGERDRENGRERDRHDIKFEPREIPSSLTVPGPGSAPPSVVSASTTGGLGVDSIGDGRRSVTPSNRSPTTTANTSVSGGQQSVILPPLRMAIGDERGKESPRLSEGSNGGAGGAGSKDAWGRVPA